MQRVRPEERLFNLVLALISTTAGLTKQQIFESVRGYVDSASSATARERMFERDKGELRSLGIPLETIDDWQTPETNQLQRYRIPKDSYDVPDGVEFDEREVRLIALASEVWRRGSLEDNAASALVKLTSWGVPLSRETVGVAPRIAVPAPSLAPLLRAIQESREVTFGYLMPGQSEPLLRRVAPQAVFAHHDRLHVYAWDVDREANRTFLLSRIVTPVSIGASASRPRNPDAAQVAIAELDELWNRNEAVLEVRDGSEAEVRLARRGQIDPEGRLRIHYTDLALLADELVSYADEVLVVDPPALREAVIAGFHAVIDSHSHQGGARG